MLLWTLLQLVKLFVIQEEEEEDEEEKEDEEEEENAVIGGKEQKMTNGYFPGALEAARATKKQKGGCNLPSDRLSLKEIQSLHGPITSVTLKPGLSWSGFCALPEHLQKEYAEAMIAHGASGTTLAEMFGIPVTTMKMRLKPLGVVFGQYGGVKAAENADRFKAWCEECAAEKEKKLEELKNAPATVEPKTEEFLTEKAKEAYETMEETKTVKVETSVKKPTVFQSGRLCFEGEGYEIAKLLGEILPFGEIEVEVNFRVIAE